MRPTTTLLALVVVGLVSCESTTTVAPHTHEDENMMRSKGLTGYDLQGAVAAVLEEVDGHPPAPEEQETTLAGAGTAYVTPDRRGQAAIVTGLVATTALSDVVNRVDVSRGGESLVEGVLSADYFAIPAQPMPPPLLRPIYLPPSTPLGISVSGLPGQTALATTWAVQLLYASDDAIAEAMRRFGEARFIGVFHQAGATSRTQTLNMQRGMRPTYMMGGADSGGLYLEAAITLDGRSMTTPRVVLYSNAVVAAGASYLPRQARLPHVVEAGQIYSFTTTVGGAATERGYLAWHGPSWETLPPRMRR